MSGPGISTEFAQSRSQNSSQPANEAASLAQTPEG